jgi:hypothetical protein
MLATIPQRADTRRIRRPAPAHTGTVAGMCRNIRTLHNYEPPTTDEEVASAALQYVRKVSGMNRPSRANEAAFARAVEAVTAATATLLDELVVNAPPRDREREIERARARAAARYA